MNLNRCDLNLLIVFDVIFREKSVTRAAQVLHLTQPAVSNALSRLREMLGDPLFVRSGNKMMPTAAAKGVIYPVREALKILQNSIGSIDNFDPASAHRTLSLSMDNIIQAIYLPGIYRQIHTLAPNLTLKTVELSREELPKEMAVGSIDFAITGILPADSSLCVRRLFSESYVCVVRHGHPFTGDILDLESYLSFQHVHATSRRTGVGLVDNALRKLGLERNISLEISSYSGVFPLVAQSDLAATVPRSLAKNWGLKVFELPVIVPNAEGFLYWHKSVDDDGANRWARNQIAAYADNAEVPENLSANVCEKVECANDAKWYSVGQ